MKDCFECYNYEDMNERVEWCHENFGPASHQGWFVAYQYDFIENKVCLYRFVFHNQEDSMAFKLRWL